MSKKKPKPDLRNVAIRIPLPPEKRQQASTPTVTKRRKFFDAPMVQKPLFDLDQGGAK